MASSQSIITSASDALLAAMANGGLSGFRQNDSSASFYSGNDWKAILMALSDEEVQRALDNATGQTTQKFRPLGSCS